MSDAPSNLIQLGKFELNSGLESDFKLVCDRFIEENLDGVVALLKKIAGPFGGVYGVPRGGSRLEEALLPHLARSVSRTCLIVDDVLTTGGSMRRAREKIAGSWDIILGTVVFARGPCPTWVKPIFQLPPDLWIRSKQ